MKRSLLFLLFVCGLCLLNGCGGNSVPPPPPLSATHLSVTAPAFATTGTPVSFTVTALDASNNVVTSYSATVQFTSTDAQAKLPSNSPLTNGTGNFFVTLITLGNQTITATDNASLTGMSSAIDVGTAKSTTHFSVSNNSGAAATRSPITLSVVALDASNTPSSGYSGTVQITTSDGKAILPPSGPLQNGAGNFQLTFETAGNQIVTATDTATPALTGTSGTIAVTATAAPAITSGSPPNGTVGTRYNPHTVKVCIFFNPVWGLPRLWIQNGFLFPAHLLRRCGLGYLDLGSRCALFLAARPESRQRSDFGHPDRRRHLSGHHHRDRFGFTASPDKRELQHHDCEPTTSSSSVRVLCWSPAQQ